MSLSNESSWKPEGMQMNNNKVIHYYILQTHISRIEATREPDRPDWECLKTVTTCLTKTLSCSALLMLGFLGDTSSWFHSGPLFLRDKSQHKSGDVSCRRIAPHLKACCALTPVNPKRSHPCKVKIPPVLSDTAGSMKANR